MANLDQIRQLNLRFKKQDSRAITKMFAFRNLNESFSPDRIEKGLSDSIAEMGPKFTQYFDLGMPANVALIFIDVCSFSTRYQNFNGDEIGEYFDNYYELIIPLIYEFGGEVDKIIGDGVVAVFGEPFLETDLNDAILNAEKCARKIILKTRKTPYSSKVALHGGTINYFKNKTGLYKEFTMIGKPITELFRLESISVNNCINYYANSEVSKVLHPKLNFVPTSVKSTAHNKWWHQKEPIENLKGVDFKNFYSVKYLP